MIYILEGPDGSGKTTLAHKIMEKTGAAYIHCGYEKGMDVKELHYGVIEVARDLKRLGMSTVIDRWALSEIVYGNVFRKGPSYDAIGLLKDLKVGEAVLIYCRPDNIEENHQRNRKTRKEMFNSMIKVVKEYDKQIVNNPSFKWYVYNFTIDDVDLFLKEVVRE